MMEKTVFFKRFYKLLRTVKENLGLVFRSGKGKAGLCIVSITIFVAVFAPVISPADPYETDVESILSRPSVSHPFGTDTLGRDVLSRIIYGTRTALFIGLTAIGIAFGVGLFMGVLSAYFGSFVDRSIILLFDAIRSFPIVILILVIVGISGPTPIVIITAVALVVFPLYGRVARSNTLSLLEEPYILAAKTIGAHYMRIIIKHIIPNMIAPLIIMAGMDVAFAIIIESGLSFLGLGLSPPTASWGTMLKEGYENMTRAGYMIIFPCGALTLTILGFSLLSEALRDVLDPSKKVDILLQG
jgi:peptide/nickel transport system permease protein